MKFIFVTGGVISSLGKGVTTASLALLLERCGYKVALQKCDPYINVDAGTMNPYQHGEVYVTADGAETDLDLGHYERFTNAPITKFSNVTTGLVYKSVIEKERKGAYLGQTVQVVPHITNEIKERILMLNTFNPDIIVTEIGGTVGDIESLPFLEAIRQIGLEYGKENVVYIHLTLLVNLKSTDEVKTKPTQHSVSKLREIGIQPDFLICRTEKPVDDAIKNKLSLFTNVEKNNIIIEENVKKSIYEIPIIFSQQNLHNLLLKRLGLPLKNECKMDDWYKIYRILHSPKDTVNIALVGKYMRLLDSYKSVVEALAHGAIANELEINLVKVEASSDNVVEQLKGVHGILVPGGFGYRGIEGKIEAIKYSRENNIPFLGLCVGLQTAVIEFARNVCELEGANSTEFDPQTPHPVIDIMEEQKKINYLGGTMRLGTYQCRLNSGSLAFRVYSREIIHERHRHRYEFNDRYLEIFEKRGMLATGFDTKTKLVEVMENKNHPFFIGVQYHPEFLSKPTLPHPLFAAFINSAYKYKLENGRY
jgi:CTP synthase